jgi:AcrR family transcriptional regulator
VAARSNVHAATIYRRWRTAEELIIDTVAEELSSRSPLPATGDLRADMLVWATNLLTDLAQPRHLAFFRALVRVGSDSRDAPTDVPRFAEPRLREIRATIDASDTTTLTWLDVFDIVLAPAYARAMLSTPMDPATEATRLVDNLIAVRDHRASSARHRLRADEVGRSPLT